MTLDGAINFHETDSYIVYTMNSTTTGQYCVVLPKNATGVMNMLVDLHMKGSFDGVSTGAKTKEQLIEEIEKEYLNIKGKYNNAMLVFPMVDESVLQNAIVNNDKQKMFDEVKKIGAITSEIYKKLTDSGVEKQNIDQKIIIVEKNDNDDRFVVWLKEQMPNFVDGIRYSDLEPKDVSLNPFMAVPEANNSVFSESVVNNPIPSGDSIFGASSSVVPNPSPSIEPVGPVVPEVVTPVVPSSDVDVFGIPNSVNGVTPSQSSAVSTPAPEVNNVASIPVVSETTVNNGNPFDNSVQQPVAAASAPNVVPPQPVQSVGLEGTTTFSPIANNETNVEQVQTSEITDEEPKKGSKGFVNLAILLAVLIGVTIASIELGKFLYSVYGA